MADRDTSENKNADPEGMPQDNSVPGAHGKGEDFHNGATGASIVRGDYDEIQPSEDVDDDED